MAFTTIAASSRIEERIENSRFIAVAREAGNAEVALSVLQELCSDFPDATHHCWAYRCGEEMRFSDDGEPGGTAGRPILEVLLKRDLDYVVVVVVRYFGGKRLGAGGLVRAYGGTAAKALDAAGSRLVEDRVQLEAHIPYDLIDLLRRSLSDVRDLGILAEEYDSRGWLVRFEVPAAEEEKLVDRLIDLSRGNVKPERTTAA